MKSIKIPKVEHTPLPNLSKWADRLIGIHEPKVNKNIIQILPSTKVKV